MALSDGYFSALQTRPITPGEVIRGASQTMMAAIGALESAR
jgi:hypothetical protein